MRALYQHCVRTWTHWMSLKHGKNIIISGCGLMLSIRASMIWILGEYCDRIDEVEEILSSFLEGFQDENPQVEY